MAKKDLGPRTSHLVAAGLVADHVLTVAVGLAAGAAGLASAFRSLGSHPLELCLGGPALLTAVNLPGVAGSARVLLPPTALFVVSILGILGILALGLGRSHPVAVIGTAQPAHATDTLGICRSSRPSPPAAPR